MIPLSARYIRRRGSAPGCSISSVSLGYPQRSSASIAAIAESAAAALIFVLIPRSKLEKLRDSFSPAQEYTPSGERGELCRRLGDAESALEGVGQCIERVGKKIDSARPDEPEIITARVKQSVCARAESAPAKMKNSANGLFRTP